MSMQLLDFRFVSLRLASLAGVMLAGGWCFAPPADAQQPASPAAPRRARRSLINEADQPALAAYRLTPDKLDKFEATARRTVDAMKKNPALREQAGAAQSGNGGSGRTLDTTAADLEKQHPDFAALIKSAGWSVRDYLLTSYALLAAKTFSGVQQAQPGVSLPAYVSRENLAFVRANQTRVDAAFRLFDKDLEKGGR
jgi:hypothetical protein